MRVGGGLPNSVQLGAAIRKIREERPDELTIEALAHSAGIDVSYLSGIENLHRNPSWEKLRVVVEALGIDLMELMAVGLTMPPDAEPEAAKPEG